MRSIVSAVAARGLDCGNQRGDGRKAGCAVIGNSPIAMPQSCPNPANDAAAISLLFNRAGFDVVEARNDLAIGEMRRVVRDFSDMTHGADMAVVYYAGHGIEIGGANYLIPVDAHSSATSTSRRDRLARSRAGLA